LQVSTAAPGPIRGTQWTPPPRANWYVLKLTTCFHHSPIHQLLVSPSRSIRLLPPVYTAVRSEGLTAGKAYKTFSGYQPCCLKLRRLSVCLLPLCPSTVCLFVRLSVHCPSIRLSVRLLSSSSVRPSTVPLFVCPSVYCPSLRLSVRLLFLSSSVRPSTVRPLPANPKLWSLQVWSSEHTETQQS
jgi:hypothetical protein